jgi:hypothetical protein
VLDKGGDAFQGIASFYSVIFVMRGSRLLLLPAKEKRRKLLQAAPLFVHSRRTELGF